MNENPLVQSGLEYLTPNAHRVFRERTHRVVPLANGSTATEDREVIVIEARPNVVTFGGFQNPRRIAAAPRVTIFDTLQRFVVGLIAAVLFVLSLIGFVVMGYGLDDRSLRGFCLGLVAWGFMWLVITTHHVHANSA